MGLAVDLVLVDQVETVDDVAATCRAEIQVTWVSEGWE